MLVSTTARTRPLGPHLSHRVGDVSGDLLRVGFPGSGDRGAAVDQRVEPLLPLVLAKRTGTSPSQPLVDSLTHQAGDRLVPLRTEPAEQVQLSLIEVDVRAAPGPGDEAPHT